MTSLQKVVVFLCIQRIFLVCGEVTHSGLASGCPNVIQKTQVIISTTQTGAVRCCSFDGGSCKSETPDCSTLTFSEAQQKCVKFGMRLCTIEELATNICCNSGCGFDKKLVWYTKVDCSDLPGSMNGPDFDYGCPGAVFDDGKPSNRYCNGIGNPGTGDSFPWWKQCCIWDGLKCQPKDICGAIHVTGETSNSEGGLYLPTDKRAPDAPNNPVWKLRGEDRFIFNTGSSSGWRIGAKSFLTNGHHWCKGDSMSLPLTSEKWSHRSDPSNCGSDGTVQVKCTKLNEVCVRIKTGNGSQWKLGAELFLTDNSYNCTSNSMSLSITADGKQCGSSGSAQIECTKFNSKNYLITF